MLRTYIGGLAHVVEVSLAARRIVELRTKRGAHQTMGVPTPRSRRLVEQRLRFF